MKTIISIFLCFCSLSLFGQFTSGLGDGSSYDYSQNNTVFYAGSTADGSASQTDLILDFLIWKASYNDGYSAQVNNESETQFWQSHEDDGFNALLAESNTDIWTGKNADGYTHLNSGNEATIWVSGQSDGFTQNEKFRDFIWTGEFGNFWENPGNWSDNAVPSKNHKVIIPSGMPNYPILLYGKLGINTAFNGYEFKCKALDFHEEAKFYLDFLNVEIHNYGIFNWEGIITVIDPMSNLIMNYSQLNISGNAKLVNY